MMLKMVSNQIQQPTQMHTTKSARMPKMTVPAMVAIENLPQIASDEKVVVQGVIDGLIINGNRGEIIDYKTDKVSDEAEIIDRYKEQMRIYKMAAEQCFGLTDVGVTLYSFALSKEISVKLEKNT